MSSPTDDIWMISMSLLTCDSYCYLSNASNRPRRQVNSTNNRREEGRRGRPTKSKALAHSVVVSERAGGMPFSNVSHACMNSGPAQSVGQTVRTECGGEGRGGRGGVKEGKKRLTRLLQFFCFLDDERRFWLRFSSSLVG